MLGRSSKANEMSDKWSVSGLAIAKSHKDQVDSKQTQQNERTFVKVD